MINSEADMVTEYQLKIFAETYVEPVLQQLALMIQRYETDSRILSVAKNKSKMFLRYKDQEDRTIDELLEGEVLVTVDAGMGATDPVQRVKKFMMGLNTAANLPNVAARMESDEIIAEIFGRLGYKDGSRFFKPEEQMQQQQAPQDPKLQIEQLRMQDNERERQLKQWIAQQEMQMAYMKYQGEMAALANRENLTMDQLRIKIEADRESRQDKAALDLGKETLRQRAERDKLARHAQYDQMPGVQI